MTEKKPAHNGRFCEMAAVTPQTILCEFERLSPAGTVVEAATSQSRWDVCDLSRVLIWLIYNCIREIESSFRCLKTDLDIRPIFHKMEAACDAHLHLGLLAYWIVIAPVNSMIFHSAKIL